MTRRELQGLVDRWQEILGLQNWSVTVRVEEFGKPEFAYAQHSASYEEAVVVFQPWLLTAKRPPEHKEMLPVDITPRLIERFVVHELVHLALARYDQVMDDHVYGGLGEVERGHIGEAFHRAKETTVDKLAVALVAAWGGK